MAKKKQPKQPSSYRTAFIRITSTNDTGQGIVCYTSDDIKKILVDWSESAGITYWFIEHYPNDDEKSHFHVVIQFRNPTQFPTIKNKFPYGKIESAKNLKATIQYLVHLNNPDKEQYSWESVETNCKEMKEYMQVDPHYGETLASVLKAIDEGIINEYNVYTLVSTEMYSRYKTRIRSALEFCRERKCMDRNRNMNVIFMTGPTRLGKTTFAKKYCEDKGITYCVSSSSNDPLQDYKGEDVLILDDLRDDSFTFADLLKLLDNHTLSSTKSRYYNKHFIGDTIIVTSTVALKDWYKDVTREDKRQLYRRIGGMIYFKDDSIYLYDFNPITFEYDLVGKAPNVIVLQDRRRKSIAKDMFKEMGIKVEKVDDERIEPVSESLPACNYVNDLAQTNIKSYSPESHDQKLSVFK